MDIGLWLPLWELVEARRLELGESNLDDDERLWLYLRRVIDEVEDQGLLGLYCTELAPDPQRLAEFWLQIDAEEMANLFEQLQSMLPNGLAPEDEAERANLIELWQDDAYAKLLAELEDDFYELLPAAEDLLDAVVRRVMEKYN